MSRLQKLDYLDLHIPANSIWHHKYTYADYESDGSDTPFSELFGSESGESEVQDLCFESQSLETTGKKTLEVLGNPKHMAEPNGISNVQRTRMRHRDRIVLDDDRFTQLNTTSLPTPISTQNKSYKIGDLLHQSNEQKLPQFQDVNRQIFGVGCNGECGSKEAAFIAACVRDKVQFHRYLFNTSCCVLDHHYYHLEMFTKWDAS